ncbi:AAA family ATPase [Agrobacterium tumefaciens]|uniref:AAA family ATPase n=1 Tax=Agrobacterium tumefaciens TaxID=358 RepID=A0A546XS02_AGRTU|nr:AAA family ATPase [Agrobacterium tumefaciens]TRB03528.1 AAA family ATPase [Agrobacterium tumefaciens]
MTNDIATRHVSLDNRPGKKLDRYHRGNGTFTKRDYDELCAIGGVPIPILDLAKAYAEKTIAKPDVGANDHLNIDDSGNVTAAAKTTAMAEEPQALPVGAVDYLNMPIPDKFKMVDAADLSEEDDKKDWVIRDVFAAGEFSYVAGVPGAGKSVIIGDASCSIACGLSDWHGHEIDRPGFVLYFAAERAPLVRRRMRAWFKHNGIRQGSANLTVVSASVNLTSEKFEDVDSIIAIIKQKEAETGKVCRFIVFDTLSRVFGPGDQHHPKDMMKLVNSVYRIMEVITGAHILLVHHTTWAGDRAKGAIDLDGSVDVSFMVDDRGGIKVMRNDGANDGEEGDVVGYTLESVELSIDENGAPINAPVVVKAEIPERERQAPANANYGKLGQKKGKAIDTGTERYRHGSIVIEIIRDIHERASKAKGIEADMSKCAAPVDVVKEAFLDRMGYMQTTDRKRKNKMNGWFNRAKESLEERNSFVVVDKTFVLPEVD